MVNDESFLGLIARVRQGDQQAATDLLARYEPHVRRVARVRMHDPHLRRAFDSADVCQSVLGEFFVRVALGQFDLNSPEQLIALLATMTRNKVINQVERERAQRRDARRVEAMNVEDLLSPSSSSTPSQIVANRELLEQFVGRLTPDERYLAEQRALGRTWPELAAELGGTPDAHRVRLSRGLDRVSAELGWDESSSQL